MPLVVDVRRRNADGYDEWVETGRLRAGISGSVSDNRPDGTRQVFVFECSADGREGILRRSIAGVDLAVGGERAIFAAALEEVARVKDGEYYLQQVQTDVSPEPRILRFRMVYDHVKEDTNAVHR